MNTKVTPARLRVLERLDEAEREGRSIGFADLGRELDVALVTARETFESLRELGLVARVLGTNRSLRLTDAGRKTLSERNER